MTDKQGVRVAKTYSYQAVRVKVLGGLEQRHVRHSLSGSGKRAMRDLMPTRRQVLGTGMIGLGLTLPRALPLTSVVRAQGSIEEAKIDFPYRRSTRKLSAGRSALVRAVNAQGTSSVRHACA